MADHQENQEAPVDRSVFSPEHTPHQAEPRLIFQDGEPPRRGDMQYVALAVDFHGLGYNQPGPDPRWCIVRWGNTGLRDRNPYWDLTVA